MGEARYIENKDKYENIEHHRKSKKTLWYESRYGRSFNDTMAQLDAEYGVNPENLTIAEKAKILRQRAGDTIEDAGRKLGKSHEWISRTEGGRIYAYGKTSQDNEQALYDLYKT